MIHGIFIIISAEGDMLIFLFFVDIEFILSGCNYAPYLRLYFR
jgi:hypothetical protein